MYARTHVLYQADIVNKGHCVATTEPFSCRYTIKRFLNTRFLGSEPNLRCLTARFGSYDQTMRAEVTFFTQNPHTHARVTVHTVYKQQ